MTTHLPTDCNLCPRCGFGVPTESSGSCGRCGSVLVSRSVLDLIYRVQTERDAAEETVEHLKVLLAQLNERDSLRLEMTARERDEFRRLAEMHQRDAAERSLTMTQAHIAIGPGPSSMPLPIRVRDLVRERDAANKRANLLGEALEGWESGTR